jgi:hypothetical protein
MATTKESNLSNFYIELNRFGQNGEYERALKTANKSKIKYIRNSNAVTTSKMTYVCTLCSGTVHANGYVLLCPAV